MRIAFYAPMKPPDSPVPSGDRLIARLFMRCLEGQGHEVALAARLRSYDKEGNAARQQRLAALGGRLAKRLIRRYRTLPAGQRPQLWFTYHLYHKAPDWVGPQVAAALGIPYVVAEASFAPKQAGGPWDIGHRAVEGALAKADLILCLNPDDIPCLLPLVADKARVVPFLPFLDAAPYAAVQSRTALRRALAGAHGLDAAAPWLLAAAMMRPGSKLASYELLAKALSQLPPQGWQLLVAGDGPAEPEVRAAFAPWQGRVCWLGRCGAEQMAQLYAAADLLVWPGIHEAIGMSLLEAQAAGLPVVCGRSGAAPLIVDDRRTGRLAAYGDTADFAQCVAALLCAPEARIHMGQAAIEKVKDQHDLAAAGARLGAMLERLIA